MNAYELAEYLCENTPDGVSYRFAIGNAAIMLRQQADRIAELEKQTELLQAKLNYMFEQELKSAMVNK